MNLSSNFFTFNINQKCFITPLLMITVLEHKLSLLLTKRKQHTQPDCIRWQPQEHKLHGINHMNMSGWIITTHSQH